MVQQNRSANPSDAKKLTTLAQDAIQAYYEGNRATSQFDNRRLRIYRRCF